MRFGIDLRYRIVDVFSDRPLSGNALCVVLDPTPEPVMSAIAREVNLSETVFVTPVDDSSYDARIFTPATELPFAGHPTLGAAFTLGAGTWTQRMPGGTVTVDVGEDRAVMHQGDPHIAEVYADRAATAVGVDERSIRGCWVIDASGTRHLLVATDVPLDRVRPDPAEQIAGTKALRVTGLGVFRPLSDTQIHARVFAPAVPGGEDPGTGSAAGAIAILSRRRFGTATDVVIHQGDEIGRPCRIEVHAEPSDLRVGGPVSACAVGTFTL